MFDTLANLIVYQWLGLNAESHAGAALHFFVMDTAKILAMLVIIIYVMGLLRALLSPEKVRDYVRGMVMERFRPERWVESYVWRIQMGDAAMAAPDTSLAGRHRYAWSEVKEIVGRLWKWVVAGIAVGALFHGYVPEGWVTEHLGGKDNWLAVPGAVLLGIPLYSNATGVIPVAEAMLGKGVAIGTTLAFMMSIAALSLPEMIILRKVIQWPALALYADVLAIAFMLVGWGFNLFSV